MNPLVRMGALGQSPWYDFITRDLMSSGTLDRLIAEDGLRGMTSNPTIFQKAIGGSTSYDDDIRRYAADGLNANHIAEHLMVRDVQVACDHFQVVAESSGGHDGLVSLEVSPALAHDTEATVAEAQRLWSALDRPNAMIKIPGTEAGLPAISQAISIGMNVNVTLLFSVQRYRAVLDAFETGLETRLAAGNPIDRIASVASFFVSRVDTKADGILAGQLGTEPLRGTAALANAGAAYGAYLDAAKAPRWTALSAHGARMQRPLWASTSTKNPAYPDTYYVEALLGADTVNTLPPATFEAYRDHGDPAIRLPDTCHASGERLAALAGRGIDLEAIAQELETEGVASFAASFVALLAEVESKAGVLTRQ